MPETPKAGSSHDRPTCTKAEEGPAGSGRGAEQQAGSDDGRGAEQQAGSDAGAGTEPQTQVPAPRLLGCVPWLCNSVIRGCVTQFFGAV
jgi:hypothetical protein